MTGRASAGRARGGVDGGESTVTLTTTWIFARSSLNRSGRTLRLQTRPQCRSRTRNRRARRRPSGESTSRSAVVVPRPPWSRALGRRRPAFEPLQRCVPGFIDAVEQRDFHALCGHSGARSRRSFVLRSVAIYAVLGRVFRAPTCAGDCLSFLAEKKARNLHTEITLSPLHAAPMLPRGPIYGSIDCHFGTALDKLILSGCLTASRRLETN